MLPPEPELTLTELGLAAIVEDVASGVPALTVMALLMVLQPATVQLPVAAEFVAVMVCEPAVKRVTE